MSNQPEENQDQNFTPEQPDAQPAPQEIPLVQQSDSLSANADEDTPPTQNSTPPLSYDQPEFYQQSEYNTPPPNVANQPPYGGNVPYNESTPPPPYAAGASPYGGNPPPLYGQPLYGYGQVPYGTAAIPPAQPLPLGEAIRQLPAQYWRVLTHPGARTFAFEQGKAAWNIVWVQLIGVAIINAIFSALAVFETTSLFSALNTTSSTTISSSSFLTALSTNALIAGLYSLIAFPVGFFIIVGIYYLFAKAFRGTGKFLPFGYCYLLILAPINIVSAVLRLVPIIGSFIGGALGIYGIVLLVFMTMAVQRLSGGKATLVILLPLIILFMLFFIFVIVFVSTNLGD